MCAYVLTVLKKFQNHMHKHHKFSPFNLLKFIFRFILNLNIILSNTFRFNFILNIESFVTIVFIYVVM